MTPRIPDRPRPDGTSPTSPWLLRNPIDFISEDHLRLRTICARIDGLADQPTPDPDAVAALCGYLRNELPLLLADEDDALMPLVLARADPEDDLPRLAQRLDREHDEIARLAGVVAADICGASAVGRLSQAVRDILRELAAATRRHLILENAVLLPLARARLTQRDLDKLRDAMLRRRGLHDLFADPQGRGALP
ncbi:MAG: Hemerythrin HHE cation binding domain [Rhodobacteraceae bacterium HLUCCA08]|nr:MAG: Hemerythrin HHE cation binding domain [Rhodobacteraceae bacterium HLUCCA08]